jgi:hypothetical protein
MLGSIESTMPGAEAERAVGAGGASAAAPSAPLPKEKEKANAIEVYASTSASASAASPALPMDVGAASGAAPPGGQRTLVDLAEATFKEPMAKALARQCAVGTAVRRQDALGVS